MKRRSGITNRRAAGAVAALVIGAGAAFGVAACGEDREGGSVEAIGGDTTGTGATTGGTGTTTGTTTTTTDGTTTDGTTPEKTVTTAPE